MKLSFVIPVYNEAPSLAALVEGIFEHAGTSDFEILFVDDGSTDESPAEIAALQAKYAQVRSIRFERNAGKTLALKTGFSQAAGEIVITMDSDLQDDPAEIPCLLAKLAEGHDLVCGWKQRRYDPPVRVIASSLYNAAVRILFRVSLRDVNCGVKAMRSAAAKSVADRLERDYHRLIPVLAHQSGFSIAEIPVTHHPRRHGRSKYGPARYFRAFADVFVLKFRSR